MKTIQKVSHPRKRGKGLHEKKLQKEACERKRHRRSMWDKKNWCHSHKVFMYPFFYNFILVPLYLIKLMILQWAIIKTQKQTKKNSASLRYVWDLWDRYSSNSKVLSSHHFISMAWLTIYYMCVMCKREQAYSSCQFFLSEVLFEWRHVRIQSWS